MLRLIRSEILIKKTNKQKQLTKCYLLNLHVEGIKPEG